MSDLNIQQEDVSGVPVEIQEVRESTPQEKATMYSRWHLLVNSNVRGDENNIEESNRIAAILKDSVRCVFFEHATRIFVCKGTHNGVLDKFESPIIEKVTIKMAAEIGEDPRGHRVHVHVLIDVTHHTILQIDVKQMRAAIWECIQQRDPNLPFPYIRLTWIPVNKGLEKYIGKKPVGW